MKTLRVLAFLTLIVVSSSALAQSADLSITLSAPESGREGEVISWILEVANHGPDPARDVAVESAIETITPSCEPQNPLAVLQPGDVHRVECSAILTFRGYTRGMIGIVRSATADPDTNNNEARQSIRIITPPDLTVRFSTALFVDPELPYTILIGYQNLAWTPAQESTITIKLPVGSPLLSLPEQCSPSGDGEATCAVGEVSRENPPPPLTIESVAPAQTVGLTIPVTVTIQSNGEDYFPEGNSFSGEVRLFRTVYVTTTADEGEGSLRSAIHEANAVCADEPCKISFRIPPSTAAWQTLGPASQLPDVAAKYLWIDGSIQARFFGDANPSGPEIEINGATAGDHSNGLVLRSGCVSQVIGLTINGFAGSGVFYEPVRCDREGDTFILGTPGGVFDSYLGSDPTGMFAVPNRWGVRVNGMGSRGWAISGNVIGGNARSGVYVTAGQAILSRNRIGINRLLSGPLSNGASGIYFDSSVEGSEVSHNYIGFNEHFGIGIASDALAVSIRGNSIQANWQQGIDFGLDGPTLEIPESLPTPAVHLPTITSARWEPTSGTTIIDGTFVIPDSLGLNRRWIISLYANDAPDESGYGEGQYFLGETTVADGVFSFAFEGDLRTKWVAATTTSVRTYVFFAKPSLEPRAVDPISNLVTTTSEFSRAVQVSP